MKAQGLVKVGRGVVLGALVLTLQPGAALAQWTHTGDASVEGKLGVGTQDPARGFHLQSHSGIFRIDRDADPTSFMLARTAPGDFATIWKTFLFGVKASGVDDGEFTIRDMGAQVSGVVSSRRLTIANNGRFAFGDVATPLAGLHIRNPVAGDILGLDKVDGTRVVTVQDDGDLYAYGEDLELRNTSTTSDGYDLGLPSTLLANTGDPGDESFIALNGDTAIICSSGDDGLLQIMDEDGDQKLHEFGNSYLYFGTPSDFSIVTTNHGAGDQLKLWTSGDGMYFFTDYDNNTALATWAYRWYDGGTGSGDLRMGLTAASGNLYTDGSMNQNHAFDLAEAYWKSEDGIEAGDVVCFDPEQPNAVVLALAAGDPTVVGVVSTDPGIVMGGGAFSAEKLADLWGEEVGAQFAKERVKIEKNLAENDPYLKERAAKMGHMKSALAKGGKKADAAQAKAQITQEEQEIADVLETGALEAFCAEHLVKVALAGRVPVKVDASYGAIRAGNLLVASATPGHAMRVENPAAGTVIGKAMESLASGQGTIMMMVLNR